MGRIACSSHIVGSKTYQPCRDGFPQTAACAGIVGPIPTCMNEKLCGNLYQNSGGKPTARTCPHGIRHPHPCRECEDAPLTQEQLAEVDSWVAAAKGEGL